MKGSKRIAYYAGCTTNYVDPDIGKSTIQVLERNGFRPIFPEQECCGIPQMVSGNTRSIIRQAEFNVRSLLQANCEIVTACTSCAMAIKLDYPKILKSEAAKELSKRTYDIIEYLATLNDRKKLKTTFHPVKKHFSYHTPCHLKALGKELVNRRLNLIRLIPGLSITNIDTGCCGIGGTFGMKRKNYAVSMKIGKPLFEEMKRPEYDIAATDCPTCKMQIQQGTGLEVTHPVQIISQAYAL